MSFYTNGFSKITQKPFNMVWVGLTIIIFRPSQTMFVCISLTPPEIPRKSWTSTGGFLTRSQRRTLRTSPYRCLRNKRSFCSSLCTDTAVLQQKLLSSP